MARTVTVNCYCRNEENVKTLQALVEVGFDANIVTGHGVDQLKSYGYQFHGVPGGRSIRGPDGTIYTGDSAVTATIYKEIGARSENETFYRVHPEPPNLRCHVVLGKNSPIGRDLDEHTAAPTGFRHKTDAEKQTQQAENKKNDEQVRAEQEKVREQQRKEREAKRGRSGG